MHLDSILILPAELIVDTLKYTDYKTVIACRRTCHHLKEIVDASSALQYTVELAGAGMCDGAPSGTVPAERLRRLREMQNAWKCPAWSTVERFPSSKGISPNHMMASGNLVVFRSCRSRASELVLLRLPSESRGIPGRLWSLDVGTNRVEGACADDSQDLLVFTCWSTVHIRTLSTGGVHPLTSTAGSIHSELIAGAFNLHIHEDLLLILGNITGINGFVWNWKTGELVAKIPLTTSYFSFLDRNHVMSIHCNFAQERGISFQVTTLPDVANEPTSHVYRFLLDLPIAVPPYFTQLQANTLPTNWSGSDNPGWFHADPNGRLLALTLGSPTADGLTVAFTQHTLFVPHDVFLSHIAALNQNSNPLVPSSSDPDGATASTPIVVPWDAWGPGHTRLTTIPYVFRRNTGLHKACGMYALGEPHVLHDRGVLRITDYHPHRVARARTCASPGDYGPGGDDGGDDDDKNDDGDNDDDGGDDDDASEEGWGHRPNCARGALPRSTQIPYVEKDIPLPDGLRSEHVQCILGEDVVLLIEFSFGGPESPVHKIEKIVYHPI